MNTTTAVAAVTATDAPAAWELALAGASGAVHSQFVMRSERVMFAGQVFTVLDTFRSLSLGGARGGVLIDMTDANGVVFSQVTEMDEWVYLAA